MLLLVSFSTFAQQTNIYQAENPVFNQQIICAVNNQLSCYQLNNGKQLWHDSSINDTRGLILKGSHLFLTQDNSVKIYNTNNGSLIHTYSLSGMLFDPVISADFLILSSQQGAISVLNINTGALLWQRQLDSKWVYPPAITEGYLITGGRGHALWALDINNGDILWQKKLANELVYQPIVSKKGIIISSFSGLVKSLDLKTGLDIWKTPLTTALTQLKLSSPNQIIGSGYDGRLYALNTNNGMLIWQTSVAESARFFFSSNAEYTASINHRGLFTLIDNTSGRIIQTRQIRGQHQVPPFIQPTSIWLFPNQKPIIQFSLNKNTPFTVTKLTLGGK